MSLPIGTRLGPYELLATIGAGAMGEVYRAKDTRLNRDVAIKVLPAAFSRDPDRLARFEREARAVAAINHQNILEVHDIGSADVLDANGNAARATYMVTELLDGDTLRARLAQGPLPLRKAVDVAMQVARGLSAAHDRGIVHRDLKPENIVLLRDGHVKILDFGLAKPSATDDLTIMATEAGMVMGTVGYMAPEQVRGEPADPRADLFALGALLYELVGGTRAFTRATAAETMTAILHDDPPPLPAAVSPGLDRIVRHALEKEPGSRFQSARDFAFALQALNESLATGAEPIVPGAKAGRIPAIRARELAAWILAIVLGISALAIFWLSRTAPSTAAPMIFTVSLPGDSRDLNSPSVSPDGTQIAFISRDRAGDAIWVRRLDAIQSRMLKGTTGVKRRSLFWSPDGRSIGFFAGGKLKVIDLADEKVEPLADAPSGYGAAWGTDGTILFSPDERTPLYRVSAGGGSAAVMTTLDAARGDHAHRWPQFLPDGRHFVFMPWNSSTTLRSIQLGSLDGGPTRPLFDAHSGPVLAGKYLIYVEELPARLVARELNLDTLEVVGGPTSVVADDNVTFDWRSGYSGVSAGSDTLIYVAGKFRVSQLTWFNRGGPPDRDGWRARRPLRSEDLAGRHVARGRTARPRSGLDGSLDGRSGARGVLAADVRGRL